MNNTDSGREKTVEEKAIVPAISAPPREPLDVARRFGFEQVLIELGPDGAYTIDGKTIYAFGPGALRLAREAGVCILRPPTIRLGEKIHANPYIEYDVNQQPHVFHIVKHGIMIDRTGAIRYLAPVYDRVDIAAYIAERALKVKSYDTTPAEDAIDATRTQVDLWNKAAKKPGDPIWWFVAIQSSEIGIAFRTQSKAWNITNLFQDITHFRKNIFRRFETATDRRVAYSLVYESMVAVKDPAPVIVTKTKGKGEYKKQVPDFVESASFMVDKPMRAGLEFGLLQELAIAIREDNAENRAALLASFAQMTGMTNVRVVEADLAPEPEPTTIEGEMEEVAETGEVLIDPVPTAGTATEFAAYIQVQLPKLGTKQRQELISKLGIKDDVAPTNDEIVAALDKEMRKVAAQYMRLIVSEQEKPKGAPISPDQAAAYLTEELAEGNIEGMHAIMDELKIPRDANLGMVPEETIMKFYHAYTSGTAPQTGGAE